MEKDNAFDLLKEELDNDDVFLHNIDPNQSQCYTQVIDSHG